MNNLCFTTGGPNTFNGAPKGAQIIELRQNGIDRFTVRYGLMVRDRLNYSQAAKELGEAIMHMAACNSMLDNREPGE